jgi:hypothetical protein
MNLSGDKEKEASVRKSSDPGFVDGSVYETRVPVSAVMLGLSQTEDGLLPVISQMAAVTTLADCLISLPNVFPAVIEAIVWVWFIVPRTDGSKIAPDM